MKWWSSHREGAFSSDERRRGEEVRRGVKCASCTWMRVLQSNVRRASSIQTRKDPDCHQMKFLNMEIEVKGAVLWPPFEGRDTPPVTEGWPPSPFMLWQQPYPLLHLTVLTFLTALQCQWSSDSLTGQVLSFLRVFEGTVCTFLLEMLFHPIQ